MKILAIRGRNLASLAERFELDFTRSPLSDAGLFAVTGPTGAGKSTLLDALCVALYNRTPRLENRGGVALGIEGSPDATLGAADVRFLLRRGEAEGYAEVDFRAHDLQSYRARWEVRRARGRVDGRLGNVQRYLFTLGDGAPVLLAEGISAVADKVPKLVGLDFEQFRRSALLAQGDFAALLKAKPDERADLLERMTGTEIYAQLSKAAYERVRAQREQVERRTKDRERLHEQILKADVRSGREAELDGVVRRVVALRDDDKRLAEAARWWSTLADQDRAVLDGEATLGEARTADAAASERRIRLGLVEQAEGLRPFVDEVDRVQATTLAERAELSKQEGAVGLAAESLTRIDGTLVPCRERVEATTRARDELRPVIVDARDLDTKVQGALGEAGRARDEATKRSGAAQDGAEAVTSLDARLRDLGVVRDEATAWLAAHARLEPVAREWTRWVDALDAIVRQRKARDELAGKVDEARVKAGEASQRLDEARVVVEARRAALGEHERLLDDAQRALEAEDGPALQDRQGHLVALRQELADAASLAHEIVLDHARAAEAERQAAEARQAGDAAKDQATRTGTEAAQGRAGEDEAQRDLDDARAAMNLTDHRASLVDGKPCPLCGALQHPWASAAPTLDALVGRLGERVATLRAQREALQRQAASLEAEAAACLRRAADHEALANAARKGLEPKQQRWLGVAARVRALEPERAPWPVVPDVSLADGLAVEVQRLDAESAPIGETLRRLAREGQRLARERKALEDERTALERVRSEAEGAGKAHDEAVRARDGLASALGERERALAEAAASVEPLVVGQPDWATALNEAPERWLGLMGRDVEGWNARRARVDELDEQVLALATRRTVAAAAADEAGREAVVAAGLLASRERALAELQVQRNALLGGREADSVEDEAEEAVRAAERSLQAATQAHRDAEGHLREAEARRAEIDGRLQKAVKALDAARVVLNAELAACDLDEVEARRRLAPDPTWRREERAALQALASALGEALARLDERRKQRARHLEQPQPPWPAEDCATRIAATRTALEEAATAENDLRVTLAIDDEHRADERRIDTEIADIKASAGVWATLSDLIGSADGKRFKIFAQGLTFEALLAHANRHLQDLSPRYSLRRAPGSDLDLQVVDHDLADEVRPSTGLSGGESFLVSLALALGLSGLAASDTRIESLFIDEGFGTLDPDTLEAALSALDALQSAGRTVGIISHVPGLAERLGVKVSVTPEGAGRSSIRVG